MKKETRKGERIVKLSSGRPEADAEPGRAGNLGRWETSDHPQARHLRLSCPAERKSFTPAGRVKRAYATCSVVDVARVLARRFCSIKGSSTSPQLMHRKTVPSVAYSGRDSAIIKPLHFLHVIPHLLLFAFLHTSANLAMED